MHSVVLVLIAFPVLGLLVESLQSTSTRYCSMANALALTGQGVLSFWSPFRVRHRLAALLTNSPRNAPAQINANAFSLDRFTSWTYYRPSMNLVLTLTQDEPRGTP